MRCRLYFIRNIVVLCSLALLLHFFSSMEDNFVDIKNVNNNPENEQITLNNSPYLLSQYELKKAVLDIRSKNCQFKNGENSSTCEVLDTCNNDDIGEPQLIPGCERRLPQAIIIGVFKGGTQEILDFLMMHPQIVIKSKTTYEINFFSHEWERGLEWYRSKMPPSVPGQITIEKSPSYFLDPDAPRRIWETIPDVKLILSVRDPVDRAISGATYALTEAGSMHELDDCHTIACGRLASSAYDTRFERYLKYFNMSQIHVVDAQLFKNDPHGVLRDIETYLGLPHVIQNRDFVFNQESGYFCLRTNKKKRPVCYDKSRGRKIVEDKFGKYRERFSKVLKPHNERFFKLLGRRFDWQ